MPKKTQSTFTKNLARLEQIASQIESADTPLEDSLKLYKEAVDISVACAGELNEIEKEVILLQKTAEGVFITKPLDV